MANPTLPQATHLLTLATQSGADCGQVQTLYNAGLVSYLFEAAALNLAGQIDVEKFREFLGLDPRVFQIFMGTPENTDQIAIELEAKGVRVDDHINQANFPLALYPTPEPADIEIIDPGCGFSEEEGLQFLSDAKLERPSYEHALLFAHRFARTTVGKKPYIVFLHEPWRGPDRDRRVVCVVRHPDDRGVSLGCPDDGFLDLCVLAGVRARK